MDYTEKDLNFIKLNYPKYGATFCANHLNRNPDAIQAFAARRGIKKLGYEKHPSLQKVNPEQFWKISTPEIAYFLGYFWADGSIVYNKQGTSNGYAIAMEIVSKDADCIMPILNKLGKWAIQKRKRKEGWQETTTITTNSKAIFDFLYQNDYKTKSFSEPTKILSRIPENLKCFWWRGYFDGDGSISFGKRNGDRWKALQFSGVFEYKWEELKNLTSKLKIRNLYIKNYISPKGHKSSTATLFRKKSIKAFVAFLSKSHLGLTRKTKKINQFLDIFS